MRSTLLNRMKSVFIIFQLFLLSAFAAQPEIGKQYTLENAFLKEAKVLSLDAQNKLYMEPVNATNAKQKWTFSQGPNGTFYMHNVALGVTKAVDSDANRPDIRNKGNYTGQHWQFTQVGDWLLISNKFQGLSRVLDTYNATGNYLFFDNKTNRTSGKFWKLKALASNAISSSAVTTTSTPVTTTSTPVTTTSTPVTTTSTPVTTTSIPVTSTEIQLTTTTSTITTNTTTNNTQQCQEGYVWVEASNGPLIYAPAGCQLAPDPDAAEIKVTGCIDPVGDECLSREAINARLGIPQLVEPCYGTNSLILRNKDDPYRSTYPAKLKHNDCQGYGRIESSKADFALVEKFIVGSEQRFIETLKKAPQLVLDFNNDELRNKLEKTNGRVPYTLVEAYVFGDLMNELANPDTRTPESNAALRWLAKGDQAVNLRTWANAQKMYNDWKHDPCAFKLPSDFPQDFKDDFNRRNKDRNLYVGCDFEDTIVSSVQGVYSITEVKQGNPDVSEFVKWGGYLTTKDVLLDRQDSFNETALSLADISVISAAAVATVGGIAAFIAAATLTTTVAYGGGVVASLAVVSAIFPFSGGITAAAAAGGAATTGAIIGVGALAGPLVIVVLAVVAITAAIGVTATDRDFHNTMQSTTPPWNIEFVMEKKIEEMRNNVSAGKGGELLFVFSDATNPRNSSKFLPFTLVVPTKEQLSAEAAASETATSSVKVTAAMTRANGKATYLFYSDGTYAKTSANKSVGFDTGYPQKMPGGWVGIPNDWNSTINAALPYQSTTKGYMWTNGKYLRLNDVKVDAGYPTNMPGGWLNMPAGWAGNVDAAIHYPPTNKHYFFKGNEYVRLTGTKVDAGYPAKLPGGWLGMPANFVQGIDAATYRNGHVYMIKGDSYIRFTGTKVDTGYPKPMSNWPQ